MKKLAIIHLKSLKDIAENVNATLLSI